MALTPTDPSYQDDVATDPPTLEDTLADLAPPPSAPSPPLNPDEKYLAFFTHSGFQNQLIQVENGILLAWYLNRTLILPKAILGEVFGWSPMSKLQLEHQLRDQRTSPSCTEYASQIDRWQTGCPSKNKFVAVPFDTIFDLTWAREHVKIIDREESNDHWLAETLDIHRESIDPVGEELMHEPLGEVVDGDVIYFRGDTRYDWRIFDVPGRKPRLGKYAAALNIQQLSQRKEKLIHFTSLFGSGRIPIRRTEHYEFFRSLQRSVTYHHPTILSATDLVTEKLGGNDNYIGIHIRSSDGWFVDALPDTVFSIVSNIDRAVLSHQHQQTNLTPGTWDDEEFRAGSSVAPQLSTCVAAAKQGKTPLVYVATDDRHPRDNKAFDLIWQSYPCSFTLDDILTQADPDHAISRLLDSDPHPVTGSMRRFLLPMVDASISSRGWIFIGSKGSTFSGYIRRLHDIFWSGKKSEQLL
ncbi:hypothetical protein DM01DRAFT_1282145 [Hesseltinella vesiculosa]|uniref:CigA protein n=1 Tax=Hesseltinella vesiculosa TaxID=101127 RepID=A0A1X2GR55_9FUNG|nr:hypothetical protein DM01DRAFT_1282145 [Hesseltinella vesiculosa]